MTNLELQKNLEYSIRFVNVCRVLLVTWLVRVGYGNIGYGVSKTSVSGEASTLA